RITGRRVFLFYDSGENRFRDVTEIADKRTRSYEKLVKSQEVLIEMELPPNPDDKIIQTAMETLFYSSLEEFSKALPSFWKSCIGSETGSLPKIEAGGLSPKPPSAQPPGQANPINPPTEIAFPRQTRADSGFVHVGNGVTAPKPIYQPD